MYAVMPYWIWLVSVAYRVSKKLHRPVLRTTVKPRHVGSSVHREQHSHGCSPEAAVICEAMSALPAGNVSS